MVLLLAAAAAAAAAPPRVIWVSILDDFGFASASFNREAPPPAEARTPRMDALAKEGVILRRHYVHSFCSPSRSSFFSGRLPVHVQQGNVQPDLPNAGVPAGMTTLPEKLTASGWACHIAGKYDIGAATHAHTPEGRGFSSSLVYFSHAVDYWTQQDYSGSVGPDAMVCGDRLVDLWDSGAPAHALNGTAFIEDLLLARTLATIAAHDFATAPLFLVYAPHATHDPLQVDAASLARLNYTRDDEGACNASIAASATGAVFPGFDPAAPVPCRRVFEALVAVLDRNIGAIADALAARGVWNETLAVAFSDNGGQADLTYGGGNNSPLRGGKGSDWEGGIRVAAFISGGAVPPAVRGTVQEGAVHGADWLATLCSLAGAGDAAACTADPRAAAAGLPPIDSLDVWPLLSGANGTSPRAEFAASATALVSGRWKLIEAPRAADASWQGAVWPNASSPAHPVTGVARDCSAGCLYDVEADRGEHTDLSAAQPATVAALRARLAAWRGTFYSNNETATCARNASISIAHTCACVTAVAEYGGFLGPYAV